MCLSSTKINFYPKALIHCDGGTIVTHHIPIFTLKK